MKPPIKIEHDDLRWLAGLLDGEGSFQGTLGKRVYPSIKLAMTDRDIVQRVADVWETNVNGYPIPSGKVSYETRINGERAVDMMMQLYPYLASRRRAKIREVAALYWQSRKERG